MVRQILTDYYTASTCKIYRPIPFKEPVIHQEQERKKRPRYIIKQTKKMVDAYEKRATARPESVLSEAATAVRVSGNATHLRQVASDLVPRSELLKAQEELRLERSRRVAESAAYVSRETEQLEETEQATGAAREAVRQTREAVGLGREAAEAALRSDIARYTTKPQRAQFYKDFLSSLDPEDRKEFITKSEFNTMDVDAQINVLVSSIGDIEPVHDYLFPEQ